MKKNYALASLKKNTLATLTVIIYFFAVLMFAYVFTMS